MIEVLFFASLREQLGTAKLQVAFEPGMTVADLREKLIADRGEAWLAALNSGNIIMAVNQHVVPEQQVLGDGDEVAFFPPVTGG